VFNLVYETNVASCRIWDALGFKRIGRVKGCGNLNSYDDPVDAIIYGRELTPTVPEDVVSEERFDKIKYYLKHQRYPDGADRAEKSRLRSAATHYRLVIEPGAGEDDEPVEKLFLKDKEVIPDLEKQYAIARNIHLASNHAGINKTTGAIAEKYHWVRIKDTASLVIKECPQCNEATTKQGAGGTAAGNQNNTMQPTVPRTSSAAGIASISSDVDMAEPRIALSQTVSNHIHHATGENTLSIDHLGYQVPVDPQILSNYLSFTTDGSGMGDDLLQEHLVDDAFGPR
jgi:H2C2 zinc finger